MTGAGVALFAAFGLAFGSFLTVVVHRTPRRESVAAGRSRCPACGATVRARHNVPVVSYALLRGRCRDCGSAISPEYPLTEAATAVLFAGAAVAVKDPYRAGVIAVFLGVMLAAALTDIHHRVIPNAIVFPSLMGFAAALVVGAVLGRVDLLDAGVGFLAFGGGLFVVALISPRGMGMGDVKLAALIGLVLGALGLRYVVVAAGLAVLGGGLGGLVALAAGRSRKAAIPFGPYLAAGAVASALWGGPIARAYLSLFA
jgi:leader peptidase (prepilin peptidase)/N-methyltransferase